MNAIPFGLRYTETSSIPGGFRPYSLVPGVLGGDVIEASGILHWVRCATGETAFLDPTWTQVEEACP